MTIHNSAIEEKASFLSFKKKCFESKLINSGIHIFIPVNTLKKRSTFA